MYSGSKELAFMVGVGQMGHKSLESGHVFRLPPFRVCLMQKHRTSQIPRIGSCIPADNDMKLPVDCSWWLSQIPRIGSCIPACEGHPKVVLAKEVTNPSNRVMYSGMDTIINKTPHPVQSQIPRIGSCIPAVRAHREGKFTEFEKVTNPSNRVMYSGASTL